MSHSRRPAIGYLLKRFPRLSETFVLNEMLGLEREGWTLRVVSRRPPEAEPRHPQLERLGAEVTTLREIDPWPALVSYRGQRTILPRLAHLVDGAAAWRHPRFSSLLGEALHLLPLVERWGIAHLHVHFATDSAVVAAMLRELSGLTYSVTLHAKDIYRQGVDFERLDRVVCGSLFAVTVCDANVAHLSRRLSAAAMSRVRRLYNGIDLAGFAVRGVEVRDADHVLAVGRLVEKKGFDVLLRALAALDRRGGSCRVTIVGEGEGRQRLEALTRELGLEAQVTFTGALDQTGVRDLMARATVLCLPCVVGSDGNQDALPTVLLEALACGLPVVTTPVAGIPEIVDDGRAGVLVPSGDAEAVAEALHHLLREPARRAGLAGAGRRRAELLFDGVTNARVLSGWLSAVVAASTEARPPAASAAAVAIPLGRAEPEAMES